MRHGGRSDAENNWSRDRGSGQLRQEHKTPRTQLVCCLFLRVILYIELFKLI